VEFKTESGLRIPAVTSAEMLEIDRMAMEETGPNLYQMMENAGRNLSLLAIEKLGENWRNSSVVVLAGTGGNGGGGICAARHLANHGVDVIVCITNETKLSEVPAWQLHILKSTPARIIQVPELKNEHPDVIIDAIIGYSLTGAPRGSALEMIQWANARQGLKISLDVPSGIDATTGDSYGVYFAPDVTHTLALPKTGLKPNITGELFLGDIGIPSSVYKRLGIQYSNPFGKEFHIKIE
jgi:NAD(P)H-hydrate epimerase